MFDDIIFQQQQQQMLQDQLFQQQMLQDQLTHQFFLQQLQEEQQRFDEEHRRIEAEIAATKAAIINFDLEFFGIK